MDTDADVLMLMNMSFEADESRAEAGQRRSGGEKQARNSIVPKCRRRINKRATASHLTIQDTAPNNWRVYCYSHADA